MFGGHLLTSPSVFMTTKTVATTFTIRNLKSRICSTNLEMNLVQLLILWADGFFFNFREEKNAQRALLYKIFKERLKDSFF